MIRFDEKDKIQVNFTKGQSQFLADEKERTGNNKSSIVRRAVHDLMWKRFEEKLEKAEKIEQYDVDLMK